MTNLSTVCDLQIAVHPGSEIQTSAEGIAKGDILLLCSSWPASGAKGRFESGYCSGFCLPVSITERSVASKAVTQGLHFGFCFHPVDMASPLSGLENWTVVQQATTSPGRRPSFSVHIPPLESETA